VTARVASRAAWGLYAVSVGFVAVSVMVGLAGGGAGVDDPDGGLNAVAATTLGLVGALVASRRRDNVLGWVLLGVSLVAALTMTGGIVGQVAVAEGRLDDARWPAWLWNWVTTLIFPAGLLMTFMLLFPDGRSPSPAWRRLIVAGWVYTAAVCVLTIVDRTPITLATTDAGDLPEIENPTGLVELGSALEPMWFLGMAFLVATVVGVVLRLRRSQGRERQQLKWFAYVVTTTVLAITGLAVASLVVGDDSIPQWLWSSIIGAGFGFGIPAAFAVAIFGYGLYEIDVVIRKTVVYAVFAAFATAVYAAVVVGLGAWVGRDNSFLTMVAAVVVAITFQPVRQRLTHLANRLVYGRRATPYEVLSEFSERVGETYAMADLLPRMATVLGEGTGATRADVWLRVGGELRPMASWPAGGAAPGARPLTDGELPPLPGADVAYPVRHQGELLGALAFAKPPSDPASPTDHKLVSDLASQAGLVLRNAGLTRELEARIEELRALQKRLVAAQDEERRRIERNIHDGAQQQLVALTVKARLVRGLADRDPAKAVELAAQLEAETQEALEDLRDLARGIYPPLLADKGLVAALEAQARKSHVPVTLAAEPVGRFAPEVEAAAYFCVLEALQNVAKYAAAERAIVRIDRRNGGLTFEVADEGRGFDPDATGHGTGLRGIADRLAALDGTLAVRSAPGAGTIVSGRIPVPHEGA
jgi:signal transduction histidine kinase